MGLQAFDISKSLLSDAAKLSWFRNSAGLCTALMPWRADRGKKWAGAAKDAVGSFNHFVDIHALYQLGNSLGIAGAAARKRTLVSLLSTTSKVIWREHVPGSYKPLEIPPEYK